MYAFISKSAPKALHVLVIGTLVAAVALLTISNLEGMPFPLVFQLLAVLSAASSVYLATRYTLRSYRYAVEPSGIADAGGVELSDLIVVEQNGKRHKLVARVALRDIAEVTVVTHADKQARRAVRKAYSEYTFFQYANTPVLFEECYVVVPEEKSVLVIPVNERMVGILKGNT